MRIIKEDCLVLAIDFQEKLIPAMIDIQSVLEKSVKLLNGIEVLGIPVLFTRQYPKGLGNTVACFKDVERVDELDKIAFSCYDDIEIKKTIDEFSKKTIIILGVEAHVCVLQTVIDLQQAGYNCVLVSDCVTSRDLNDMKIGVNRAKDEGAIITTYESLLFEMQRFSGNDNFKAISKIVK